MSEEAPKKLTVVQAVKQDLMRMEGQFKLALPPHINPKRFVRVAMTAVSANPKILEANRVSLYAELTKCAQDGLLPDGSEAAIVPYGQSVSYQPMIKGICKKARNSGEISVIGAEVVCENDEYDSWIDEHGPHFKHKKARKDRGEVYLTYAYGVTKDGGHYHEEVDEADMKKIESCSKGKNTPWKGPFRDEMKKKSALKRLCKYKLPSSSDLMGLVDKVNDFYDFNPDEQNIAPDVSQPSRTKDLMNKQRENQQEEEAIETTSEAVNPPPLDANDEVPI